MKQNQNDRRNWNHTYVTSLMKVKAMLSGGAKTLLEIVGSDISLASVLKGAQVVVEFKPQGNGKFKPREFRHAGLQAEPSRDHLVRFLTDVTLPGKFNAGDEIVVFSYLGMNRDDKGQPQINAQCLGPMSWAFRKDYDAIYDEAKAERDRFLNKQETVKEQSRWIIQLDAPSIGIVELLGSPTEIANELAIAGHEIVDGVWKNSPADISWKKLNDLSGAFEKMDGLDGRENPPYLEPNRFIVEQKLRSGGINRAGTAFEKAEADKKEAEDAKADTIAAKPAPKQKRQPKTAGGNQPEPGKVVPMDPALAPEGDQPPASVAAAS